MLSIRPSIIFTLCPGIRALGCDRRAVVVLDHPVGSDEGAARDVGRPAVPTAVGLPYRHGTQNRARNGQYADDADPEPESRFGGGFDRPACELAFAGV
jgi:hypothetical protein